MKYNKNFHIQCINIVTFGCGCWHLPLIISCVNVSDSDDVPKRRNDINLRTYVSCSLFMSVAILFQCAHRTFVLFHCYNFWYERNFFIHRKQRLRLSTTTSLDWFCFIVSRCKAFSLRITPLKCDKAQIKWAHCNTTTMKSILISGQSMFMPHAHITSN